MKVWSRDGASEVLSRKGRMGNEEKEMKEKGKKEEIAKEIYIFSVIHSVTLSKPTILKAVSKH